MKRIELDYEDLMKAEDGELEEADKKHFDTDKKVKVQIPVEAYLTLEFNCDNLEIAALEAVALDSYLGILGVEGGYVDYGRVNYEEVRAKFVGE